MISAYVAAFCRMVILIVFAWSFWGKVRDRRAFEGAIARFQLLPQRLHPLATIIFLAAELAVVGSMFIGGQLLPWGFGLAVVLLAIFSVALASVLIRKIQASCNCFGTSNKLITSFDIIRNIGMLACGVAGFSLSNGRLVHTAIFNYLDWGLIVLIAGVVGVLWTQLGEIANLIGKNFIANKSNTDW